MTNEEIVDIVSKFRDLLKDVKTAYQVQSEIVNEADKAFGDIRHKCELDYPTSGKGKTQICRLIEQYSKQRRMAKERMQVLEPLVEFANKHGVMISVIGNVANAMNRELKHVQGEKKYAPRVLTDLFKVNTSGN